MNKRIVITGMGCITPIGHSVNEFWANCIQGVKGFSDITLFDKAGVKTSLVAEVKDFNPVKMLGRKQGRRLDRYAQFAVHAAREAACSSRIDLENKENDGYISSDRLGVCLGTGVGGVMTFEQEVLNMTEKGSTYVNPLLMPKWIPNMAAANISMDLGIHGPVHTVSTACASGIDAIGHALMLIDSGRADAVLAGGAEACITPTMISGFENMGALSQETDPEKASVPFDENRNGFILGEGAAVLVIESLESAMKRKANIIAEIVGYGSSTDAYHLTAPQPDAAGGVKAIRQALNEASIEAEAIDYISAHGTSTPQNDKTETVCIHTVLGESANQVPVNSTKSMVGHMQGAAGALETIVCALSLKEGLVHPTAGTNILDSECDLNVIKSQKVETNLKYALNNALGFGGHNASLVLKKFE